MQTCPVVSSERQVVSVERQVVSGERQLSNIEPLI